VLAELMGARFGLAEPTGVFPELKTCPSTGLVTG
jgi:hypothetical protein